MPIRRDPRTGRSFFRVTVKLPDGSQRRLFGTPGVPGPYQELAPNQAGAKEVESDPAIVRRCGCGRKPPACKGGGTNT